MQVDAVHLPCRPTEQGIRVQHDYTEAGHGKGLHDSEGGIVKALVNGQLNREDYNDNLRSAAGVVAYCDAELKVGNVQAGALVAYLHACAAVVVGNQREGWGRAGTA